MMRILAESSSEQEVCENVPHLDFDGWLNFLGPKGWESLCLGFLILEYNFVPTGLIAGGTLEDFDMIGADGKTGEKIYAQCKKNPGELSGAPTNLLDAVKDQLGTARVFLFAYRGCQNCPEGITLITVNKIKQWFADNPKGQRYRSLIDRQAGRG